VGALFGKRVTIGQEHGPDVELVVFGDEFYARYETPEGYTAIYDDASGRFVYARLEGGRFVSSGVPVTEAPPPGAARHAQEAPAVRQAKAAARQARRGGSA
jgi:hypothetical protein